MSLLMEGATTRHAVNALQGNQSLESLLSATFLQMKAMLNLSFQNKRDEIGRAEDVRDGTVRLDKSLVRNWKTCIQCTAAHCLNRKLKTLHPRPVATAPPRNSGCASLVMTEDNN